MGWKISALVINKKYDNDVSQIAKDLGYGKFTVDKTLTLQEALYPDNLCLGYYNDKTIITHGAIIMNFFDENPSEMEQKFSAVFKDTEILVIGLMENAGITGYSYIKDGKRVRTKLIGEEEGEIINTGNPLKEEYEVDDYDLPFEMPKIFLGQDLSAEEVLNTIMFQLK